MKLYRKVLCSERLPDRGQFYITHHEQGSVMYLCWIPEHEVFEDADEYQFGPQEITSWLEPIEITEKKILEVIEDNATGPDYSDWELVAKAILSKLKGE